MLGLLPLLIAMTPVTTLPGLYRSQQMEVGAGLELRVDGRFRYALEYGAVSELGEGRWTIDGDALVIERYGTPIRFKRVAPPLKQPPGE